MKKIFATLLLILTLIFALASCGGEGDSGNEGGNGGGVNNPEKITITGITFADATYTYDGTEKALAISGTLPEGVSVSYSSEKATNAGTYNAKATLSGDNYNTLVLEAKLTINKADITGIIAEAEQSIKEDGENHLPVYSGTLPSGVSVKYVFDGEENNEGVNYVGTYEVDLVFYGDNYNDLTIPVTYKVQFDLSALASRVTSSFGTVPDVWQYLPDSFSPENRALASIPDYSDFVNVSNIPLTGMGKQLNVVYTLLARTQAILKYVNTVYGAMNTITNLYQAYLDNDPDDPNSFEGNAGPFSFSLDIGDDNLLYAAVAPVEITVFSLADGSYGAKIKVNSTTYLKYTVTENSLVVAMDVLDSVSTLVEFSRNPETGITAGVVYEYITIGETQVTATSALVRVEEDYTVVIGTKGDFIPTSVARNCEVYDNASGQLVGTKVREEVDVAVFGPTLFNTYWFPLYDLEGIDSIKKLDKMNGTNADTIWINGFGGEEETIHTTLMAAGLFDRLGTTAQAASRRYDVEFKTMYFFVFNEDTEEYESVTCEIPMLFIQEEAYEVFDANFEKANEAYLDRDGVSLAVTAEDKAAIDFGYNVLLPIYDELKEAITHEHIINYCKS